MSKTKIYILSVTVRRFIYKFSKHATKLTLKFSDLRMEVSENRSFHKELYMNFM